MKLMFNKFDYHGKWFEDNEINNDFTEKVPADTGYTFDEKLNDWVLKQEYPELNQ